MHFETLNLKIALNFFIWRGFRDMNFFSSMVALLFGPYIELETTNLFAKDIKLK